MGLRRAIYPGTFDPITNGHLDIIGRAAGLVDTLTIGVALNAGKGPIFSAEERQALVREDLKLLPPEKQSKIQVTSFGSLLMDFVSEVGATCIFRGLRAVSDFEYEFQMAGMNARLNRDVETVFLMASERHQFISSRFVKEIGRLGGDISSFVSPHVRDRLLERFAEMNGET